MTATGKRLCLWPLFLGVLVYWFGAKTAVVNWPILLLALFNVMLETGQVIILLDSTVQPRILKQAGTMMGLASIISLIALGASFVSFALAGGVLVVSIWVGVLLRRSHRRAAPEATNRLEQPDV